MPGADGPGMVVDSHNRPLRSLRLSVTDRCNLRCTYCMPEENYVWLPKPHLLTYEELCRIADSTTQLGVTRIRITGGEPLLRQDLSKLVAKLKQIPQIEDIALTTNGVLLADYASKLRKAGLSRITLSLDTLRPNRFKQLTGKDDLAKTLRGLEAARAAGFTDTKINTVVIRGTNDDELIDLLALAQEYNATLRFIEYMDVGGATEWKQQRVVPKTEILNQIESALGRTESLQPGSAPAQDYRLQNGLQFGIISSVSDPFCGSCDRARVTADGVFFTCLYAQRGTHLREKLRAGASNHALTEILRNVWQYRSDRGAIDRAATVQRGPLIPVDVLRQNPHQEMHTRGG